MKPKIVIIDSGIDPELVHSKTSTNIGVNKDLCGHGTACAMVIEKICPEAEIISLQILDHAGKTNHGNLYEALRYCLGIDCHIINLSLSFMEEYSSEIELICKKLREQGKTVVASVINGRKESFPAILPTVIGVRGQRFCSFDEIWFNPRMKIQFIADKTPVFTDLKLGKYTIFSGNSKATALSSGLIALEMIKNNVDAYKEITEILVQKSSRTMWNEEDLNKNPEILANRDMEINNMELFYKIKKIFVNCGTEIYPSDDLFRQGIVTSNTIGYLINELNHLFQIEINFENTIPKDLFSINNIYLTVTKLKNLTKKI